MSEYFALQVRTGDEEGFIKRFHVTNPGAAAAIYFLTRKLDIRKAGKIVRSDQAIFPGYLFAELEEGALAVYQRLLRKTKGFYRFLPSNQNVLAMKGSDLEIVLHFIKRGSGVSTVYFNEQSRIVVTQGPLMGLEGHIIKVDKRKKRARIKLDLYRDSFAIDFAFEELGALPPANG
jgi:transcriptional antiterminator NusG